MYTNLVKSIKEDIKELKTKENYPDRLPIKIETIEMSLIQNIEYMKARDIEKKKHPNFMEKMKLMKLLDQVLLKKKMQYLQVTELNLDSYLTFIFRIFKN